MNPWAAIAGASKWMSCTPAQAQEAARRAATCERCPSRVIVRVRGTTIQAAFCGPPMDPREDTCGCLVQWRSGGLAVWRPAGKTTCDGEGCPAGHW